MLRLGFDAKRFFNNYTGLGNYSRNIIHNLSSAFPENEYYLYTPKVGSNTEANEYIKTGKYNLIQAETPFKSLWRSYGVRNNLIKDKIHVFHGLSNEIPFGMKKTKIRTVVTIHDLIFLKYPELYPLVDRSIYDIKFRYACKNADIVIAISKATKNDIVKYYNIDPHKIKVVYQPCADNFFTPKSYEDLASLILKHKLPSSYILYVGSVIRRKNLLNVVKTYKILPDDLKLPLVIVGRADNAYKQNIIEYIRQNQLDKYIIWLENISNNDLPAIYQKASLFIYPSQYEGFGIPVLEALFSKVPVITSNTSSLPEVVGNGAIMIDSDKPDELYIAMKELLLNRNFYADMQQQALRQAVRFNWKASARELLKLIGKIEK